jgi:hypothetical protein
MKDTPIESASSRWFQASEATGDFMGIRYGRIPPGSEEVDWHYVSHSQCDGIGGFARLLRERGAEVRELPETKNPCTSVLLPLWRRFCDSQKNRECANRSDWAQVGSHKAEPRGIAAWHLFSEQQTQEIIRKCRRDQVTVNSHLLKHLDQAVRPETRRPHLEIPWMIPVNLRGDIMYPDDTENHVSCVEPRIAPHDSAKAIQQKILHRLQRGEHRANHLLLGLGKYLSHDTKVKVLTKDRSKPAGNIGAFSNLGAWDPDKKMGSGDSWLFCPPVVKGQLLGAGCVTFQNRLGLAIQPHPCLSASPDRAAKWMERWVGGI